VKTIKNLEVMNEKQELKEDAMKGLPGMAEDGSESVTVSEEQLREHNCNINNNPNNHR